MQRNKASFTFDTKENNNVKKTIDIDFFKSVEECGNSLYVQYYDENENVQVKYCKSIEFHN